MNFVFLAERRLALLKARADTSSENPGNYLMHFVGKVLRCNFTPNLEESKPAVTDKKAKKRGRPAREASESKPLLVAVHEVDGRLEVDRASSPRRRQRESDAELECVYCHMRQHARCVHLPPDAGAEYMCPPCLAREGRLFRSSATLIVVPQTLLQQWLDELHKHVDAALNLRVLVLFNCFLLFFKYYLYNSS